MPVTYQIRDIDPDVWTQFKVRAESQNLPMKSVLVLLIQGYTSGAIEVVARPVNPSPETVQENRQ